MARGWESKSVESQMDAAEARRTASRDTGTDPAVATRNRERESLMLSRKRIVNDLERAQHPRHRATLEAALKHLDEKIADLA